MKIMTVIAGMVLSLASCTHDEWMENHTDGLLQGDALSVSLNLPQAKPGFVETVARSTESAWVEGNELLMRVALLPEGYNPEGQTSDGIVEEFYTLTYNGTDWSLPENALLISEETISLKGTLTVRVPEEMPANVTADVDVYYAPECEWDEAASTLKPKADAMTQAPEVWFSDEDDWTTRQARLCLDVASKGKEVVLNAPAFKAFFESQDGIYKATSDSLGKAYFYGTVDPVTGDFVVQLEAMTQAAADGWCEVYEGATLLKATPFVPIELEKTKSYLVKASEEAGQLAYTVNADSTSYQVYTCSGLMAWATSPKVEVADVKLMKDIALPAKDLATGEPITLDKSGQVPSGSNWPMVGSLETHYSGTIDGNGKTISGLRIYIKDQYIGFVSLLGETGLIKDLTLSDAVVCTPAAYVGIFVGRSAGGTVKGCVADGYVTGCTPIANIVGYSSGSIIACAGWGVVTDLHEYLNEPGGILGMCTSGTVIGCCTNFENIIGLNLGASNVANHCFADQAAVTEEAVAEMNTALAEHGYAWTWTPGSGAWPAITSTNN